MSKIQVLLLRDRDLEECCYVTRSSYFHDAQQFMKECLLKPHTVEYEVREVYWSEPRGELAELVKEEFWCLFDDLACNYNPDELFKTNPAKWNRREFAFDLFWKNGDEWRFA